MRASFRVPDSISYSLSKLDLQVRGNFFHDYVTDLQQMQKRKLKIANRSVERYALRMRESQRVCVVTQKVRRAPSQLHLLSTTITPVTARSSARPPLSR
jgi:hypothetical protein